MSQAIGDNAAILFASGFYDALGAGKSIEFAYKYGRNALQLAGIPEHLTPVLRTNNPHREEVNERAVQLAISQNEDLVLRLARSFNPQSRQYTSQFIPPLEVADEALRTILALSNPSVWKEFVITRDVSRGAWMGSESETLIDTLYSLMLPAVVFNLMSSSLNRNFTLLSLFYHSKQKKR